MNILSIFKKKKDNELVGNIKISLIRRDGQRLKPIELMAIKSGKKLAFTVDPFAFDKVSPDTYDEYFALVCMLRDLKPEQCSDMLAESIANDRKLDDVHKHIKYSTGIEKGYSIKSSANEVIVGLLVSKRILKEMLL